MWLATSLISPVVSQTKPTQYLSLPVLAVAGVVDGVLEVVVVAVHAPVLVLVLVVHVLVLGEADELKSAYWQTFSLPS